MINMTNNNMKEICDNFTKLQSNFAKVMFGASNNEIDIEALSKMEEAIKMLKKLK